MSGLLKQLVHAKILDLFRIRCMYDPPDQAQTDTPGAERD